MPSRIGGLAGGVVFPSVAVKAAVRRAAKSLGLDRKEVKALKRRAFYSMRTLPLAERYEMLLELKDCTPEELVSMFAEQGRRISVETEETTSTTETETKHKSRGVKVG